MTNDQVVQFKGIWTKYICNVATEAEVIALLELVKLPEVEQLLAELLMDAPINEYSTFAIVSTLPPMQSKHRGM